MKYSKDFEEALASGTLPEYKVFPVSEEPVPFTSTDGTGSLTWQGCIMPAPILPSETYFEPAAQPNNVILTPLTMVSGEKLSLFHMLTNNYSPDKHDEHKQRMLMTLGNISVLANSTQNPELFNETLTYRRGTERPYPFRGGTYA